MLILETFPSGPFATNTFVIGCSASKKGVFIDPAPGAFSELMKKAKKHSLTIEAIWLTHSHWDHIGDLAAVQSALNGVPIYVHPADAKNVKNPGSDGLPLMEPVKGAEPDYDLVDGENLRVGELSARVIATPGHTPGGVCFYFEKEKILISGDTLFKGSIGNLSFPTAEPSKMWHSLKKLAKLPSETLVYPGHGGSTTIQAEDWLDKAENHFS